MRSLGSIGTPPLPPRGQGDEDSAKQLERVAVRKQGHQGGRKDVCSGGRGGQSYQMLPGVH